MSLIKRIIMLVVGNVFVGLGVACVIHSSLGAFSITLAVQSIGIWLGLSLAAANFLVEGVLLLLATYYKEGIGWTALSSLTIGSMSIGFFNKILPFETMLWVGVFLLPLGWALMGKCGWGHTSSNILTEALMKKTKIGITPLRMLIDGLFLVIAFIGLPHMINWFTLFLTFGTGPILKVFYNLLRYDPSKVEHEYLITFKKI